MIGQPNKNNKQKQMAENPLAFAILFLPPKTQTIPNIKYKK